MSGDPKVSVKPGKAGVKLDMAEATCMECHGDMVERSAFRSLTWYFGFAGVRALLCSHECRTAWDTKQRALQEEAK